MAGENTAPSRSGSGYYGGRISIMPTSELSCGGECSTSEDSTRISRLRKWRIQAAHPEVKISRTTQDTASIAMLEEATTKMQPICKGAFLELPERAFGLVKAKL